ncbi:hypothetical protein like AT1G43760 [Hibiscus trionum]|uniref:Endonuclease/exonuclease/phosphatase domain-containing protein n=1 Tax=Hibiscus trionum TaxID=183268 RepID=A0A9W7HS33_HIBTR|nr:hypothetical protein like AT1G43760 [Hibiscus trionum]
MGFHGPFYTWERGDLKQRLDRCVCNEEWLAEYPTSGVFHLPKLESDHCPVLLTSGGENGSRVSRPFRYLTSWAEHPDFHRLVTEVWREERNVFDNVIEFQTKGAEWNKEVYGHIGRQKTLLLARIRGIELARGKRDSEFLIDLEKELKLDLAKVLKDEESLWRQKSRNSWILDGDRNTRFFHASTIVRR